MAIEIAQEKYLPKPEQSVELLKALHILTRDGKLNQDTRRKLKQVQHLLGFIEPLLQQSHARHGSVHLVDHGAGKSYLGFLLYDAYFKNKLPQPFTGSVIGVEARSDLVTRAQQLAQQFGFTNMQFLHQTVAGARDSSALPPRIDIVTALHACDTASDDAIAFGLAHQVQHMVLIPCCQAELASGLRHRPSGSGLAVRSPLSALWQRPIHTREFGSQLTNVLRCLLLESQGYTVTVTELVGWEHSMKNELILATLQPSPHAASAQQKRQSARQQIETLLQITGLEKNAAISARFLMTPFTTEPTNPSKV